MSVTKLEYFVTTLDHLIEVGLRLGCYILYGQIQSYRPFVRHIDEDELWMYRYPSIPGYLNRFYLHIILVAIPCLLFLYEFIIKPKGKATIQSILNHMYGLSLAYSLNAVATAFLKAAVGRPRPNFFFRCFPDGVGTDVKNCTGEYASIMDARKSFPSAHASFAFTSMVYCTLHLVKLLDFAKPRYLRGLAVCVVFLPLFIATGIAVSRTTDYHHHYSDVVAGAVLGAFLATMIYWFYSQVNIEEEEQYVQQIKLDQLQLINRLSAMSITMGD